MNVQMNGKRSGTIFVWSLLLLTTGLLLACGKSTTTKQEDTGLDPNTLTQEEVAVNSTTIQYNCDKGQKLTAVYDHSDTEAMRTVIHVQGNTALQNLELKSVAAASGAKSSNGKIVWWTKENLGVLMHENPPLGDGKILVDNCKEIPSLE